LTCAQWSSRLALWTDSHYVAGQVGLCSSLKRMQAGSVAPNLKSWNVGGARTTDSCLVVDLGLWVCFLRHHSQAGQIQKWQSPQSFNRPVHNWIPPPYDSYHPTANKGGPSTSKNCEFRRAVAAVFCNKRLSWIIVLL
jgi:hypothetical protein